VLKAGDITVTVSCDKLFYWNTLLLYISVFVEQLFYWNTLLLHITVAVHVNLPLLL